MIVLPQIEIKQIKNGEFLHILSIASKRGLLHGREKKAAAIGCDPDEPWKDQIFIVFSFSFLAAACILSARSSMPS